MSERLPTYMKRKLFSELRDRVDAGTCCPSLAWIVKFCRLSTPEQAEQLLRDLERDAVINVLRCGPYPWVSVIRNTYSGPKVPGMTLDPERFDKFEDGNDVLVVKDVPPAGTRAPRQSIFDDPDNEETPVTRTARPAPVAPPVLPKVETVTDAREFGSPRRATADQGPEATPAGDTAAETVSEPIASPLQSVEARNDPEGDDHDGRTEDGAEHQRRADDEQCDAPRLPGTDGRGKGEDAAAEGRRPVVLESDRSDGVEPRIVDRQDEDRRIGHVGGEAPDPIAEIGVNDSAFAVRIAEFFERAERPEPERWGDMPWGDKPQPVRSLTITLNVTPDEHAFLTEYATRNHVKLSRAAYNLLLVGIDGVKQPQAKPRIRARVMAALRRDGRPYNQFIEDLLDLGLEQYLAFRNAK